MSYDKLLVKPILDAFIKGAGLRGFTAGLHESLSPGELKLYLERSIEPRELDQYSLIECLEKIAEEIRPAAKMKGFKTESIGKMTPEVLLAQAAEMKFTGLILVGILEDHESNGKIPFAYNSCGLSTIEYVFLVKNLEARAIKAISSQEQVDADPYKK